MFCNLEMLFQKLDFYIWMKEEKTDLVTVTTPTGRTMKKNCSETRRSMVETGKFYIKL